MFVAWFTVITVFVICTYLTISIFDGIEEIDAQDLADLQSTLKHMAGNKEHLKQAI
ncbi:hypothetical protein [Neobacillus bataviensis]|uniref:hypothetical protein n=1 Tax=Neobacillus bataviensis TaxID=220685 RepID=UPI0002F646BB|nr:hypothetical protein [Neobacillus bataviensis]